MVLGSFPATLCRRTEPEPPQPGVEAAARAVPAATAAHSVPRGFCHGRLALFQPESRPLGAVRPKVFPRKYLRGRSC